MRDLELELDDSARGRERGVRVERDRARELRRPVEPRHLPSAQLRTQGLRSQL